MVNLVILAGGKGGGWGGGGDSAGVELAGRGLQGVTHMATEAFTLITKPYLSQACVPYLNQNMTFA